MNSQAQLVWTNGWSSLYHGDARRLVMLPDESVDCAVFSPPYWGLRLYHGVGPSVWGGDPQCVHEWGDIVGTIVFRPQQDASGGVGGGRLLGTRGQQSWTAGTGSGEAHRGQFCQYCQAWLGCLGLEPVVDCLAWARAEPPCPRCYVCHMRMIMREVWRVLKPWGTCWLNVADSYAGSGQGWSHSTKQNSNKGSLRYIDTRPPGYISGTQKNGLKPKDLCLVPARLALALQQDGWWVRQEITLCKVAPMPESVRDRFTTATEKVFLMTKSQRYYFDQEAVKEPAHLHGAKNGASELGATKYAVLAPKGMRMFNHTRNRRNWWLWYPQPFKGTHFAVFPEAIPRVCILAGTSEYGNCSACGRPWARVESTTLSFRPTCTCGAPAEPAVVLDPFVGSGTTLVVAQRLGRRAVGVDLSLAYLRLAEQRLRTVPLPLRETTSVQK